MSVLQTAAKSTAAAPQQQPAAKATPSKSLFGSKPSAAAAKPAVKSSSSSSGSSSSSSGISFSPKLQAELTAKLGSAKAVDALQKRAEAYSKGVSKLIHQHLTYDVLK
jgi:hypothetical protein